MYSYLRNEINDLICKGKFHQGYKKLEKEIRKGDKYNSSNNTLKRKLSSFHNENQSFLEKPYGSGVELISNNLRGLASEIEKNLIITPKNYSKLLSDGVKIIVILISIISGLFGLYSLYSEIQTNKQIPVFESEATRIVIYDFDKFTSNDHLFKIEDIIAKSINQPIDNEWNKYFEARRVSNHKKFKDFHFEKGSTKILQKIGLSCCVDESKLGEIGITGYVKELKDSLKLNISVWDKNNKLLFDSISFKIHKDLNKIIFDHCQQAKLLGALSLVKLHADVNTDLIGNLDKEPCSEKILIEIKKLKDRNFQIKIREETEEQIEGLYQSLNICHSIPKARTHPKAYSEKTGTNLWEVFCEIKEIARGDKNIHLDMVATKDTIQMKIFYNIDRSTNDLVSTEILNELGRIIKKNKVHFYGYGHTCEKGEPSFDNNNLSRTRIIKLLHNLRLPESEKNWKAYGSDIPLNSGNHEKNRRATINFFL